MSREPLPHDVEAVFLETLEPLAEPRPSSSPDELRSWLQQANRALLRRQEEEVALRSTRALRQEEEVALRGRLRAEIERLDARIHAARSWLASYPQAGDAESELVDWLQRANAELCGVEVAWMEGSGDPGLAGRLERLELAIEANRTRLRALHAARAEEEASERRAEVSLEACQGLLEALRGLRATGELPEPEYRSMKQELRQLLAGSKARVPRLISFHREQSIRVGRLEAAAAMGPVKRDQAVGGRVRDEIAKRDGLLHLLSLVLYDLYGAFVSSNWACRMAERGTPAPANPL